VDREIIRVEPLSTYLENWKAPTSVVTRAGDTVYVAGLPRSAPTAARSPTCPLRGKPRSS
jgi:2-iminobutanoate/2-iminopropanoate deaminase